jgi:MFS family permease
MRDQAMAETEPPDQPSLPAKPLVEEDNYAVFDNKSFVAYLTARFIAAFGQQMLTMAVDWELYERTHSPLALGMVGLSMMVPMILCTLPAGHIADTVNRKTIMLGSTVVLGLASLGLTLVSAFTAPHSSFFQIYVYLLLIVIGGARTFLWPASAAFLPGLVGRKQLARAVTFNSASFQLSAVLGPAAGGIVIWLTHGAWVIYALNVVAATVSFMLVRPIHYEQKFADREPVSLRTLIAGFKFVFTNKIILGTISLDMFAVLLGGAVSLLPIFAKDILQSGPNGLGLLRAAIPIGAVVCALIIAHRPPMKKAGATMLGAVAIFGLATLLFGIMNQQCLGRWIPAPNAIWFWLAFLMLALSGFVDNISVVVRQTLVQLLTPDEKRGRVSAVNSLFIGTSNELGGAESGFTAWLFGHPLHNSIATGTIISVVTGGFGTLVVVLAVAWIWPEIRRYGKLS